VTTGCSINMSSGDGQCRHGVGGKCWRIYSVQFIWGTNLSFPMCVRYVACYDVCESWKRANFTQITSGVIPRKIFISQYPSMAHLKGLACQDSHFEPIMDPLWPLLMKLWNKNSLKKMSTLPWTDPYSLNTIWVFVEIEI